MGTIIMSFNVLTLIFCIYCHRMVKNINSYNSNSNINSWIINCNGLYSIIGYEPCSELTNLSNFLWTTVHTKVKWKLETGNFFFF